MKNYVLIFLSILIFSCGNNSVQKKETQPQKPIAGQLTEIEFVQKIHDFGQLQAGEIIICNFEFTNTGENTLQIEKIESDCGCVQTRFPKKPVLQGEKGMIEVEFNTSGLFGKQYKTIEITANFKEPKQLAIFAEVQNKNLEIKY